MFKADLTNWNKNDSFSKVLLFASALDEGLDYQSFESYKLPALNSHYICNDILKTIEDIEKDIIRFGNFSPMGEEFEFFLNNDYILNSPTVIHPFFISKNKDVFLDSSDFQKNSKDTENLRFNHYKTTALHINNVLFPKPSFYIRKIQDLLIENIFNNDLDFQKSCKNIYSLSRALLSELINSGYSKEFLYREVHSYFFSTRRVTCTKKCIINFISKFDFSDKKYEFVYPIEKRFHDLFSDSDKVLIRNPTSKEKTVLKLKTNEKVISIECIQKDPYSIAIFSKNYIHQILSIYRLGNHTNIGYKGTYVCIKSENGRYIDTIPLKSNLILRTTNNSEPYAKFNTLIQDIDNIFPEVFLRAAALHNHAIENSEPTNQLLNLWTIIEMLIDVNNSDKNDKIVQICNVLIPALNRSYLYSNIRQLTKDIESCVDSKELTSIFSKLRKLHDKNYLNIVYLLSVNQYETEFNTLLDLLSNFPLLQYRIRFFKYEVLKNSETLYKFLIAHSDRVKWHIMRIYRNRSMIIHGGEYNSYIDLILESLHYYVDELMDTLIEYYYHEITDHKSIFRDIQLDEIKYYQQLGVNVLKNSINKIEFTDDNAIDLIFNNYGRMNRQLISDLFEF